MFFSPVFDVIAQKNETFHIFSHFKLAQRTAVLPLWYNKRKKNTYNTSTDFSLQHYHISSEQRWSYYKDCKSGAELSGKKRPFPLQMSQNM